MKRDDCSMFRCTPANFNLAGSVTNSYKTMAAQAPVQTVLSLHVGSGFLLGELQAHAEACAASDSLLLVPKLGEQQLTLVCLHMPQS